VRDVPHPIDAKRNTGDLALAELARLQWGVVSLAQLQALGFGRGSVAKRVQRGRLHSLHRGVYAVGHRRLTREGAYLAAVLACGEGAVLSHRSAGHHWGLLRSEGRLVDVSVPRARRQRAGIRLHRPRSLDAQDTTTQHGIPITTVPRTIADLPGHHRARALAQAERLRLDVGHHTAPDPAQALTRSELEARFLELIEEAALPRPLVNTSLDAQDHGRLEVDFHWPEHRLIVETDGFETHGTPTAFTTDRRRDAALTAAGYRVVRFAWGDVAGDAGTVALRLRALLVE
jgi:very-short-patch-repair endonuclease